MCNCFTATVVTSEYCSQGRIQEVCLAVMTGPFVPQVLVIKADKIPMSL